MDPNKTKKLRSSRWFAPDDLRSFGHRSRMKQVGFTEEEFASGKPIIGIINTWNGFNTCHSHFPERVQRIKSGVTAAGGFAVELPAMSLGEQLIKPTAMLYRNLLAMEVEELLRAYPVDGAVLMGGCDKTTPATLMGAISMNLPAIYVPAGPMLRGNWRGGFLGSGSDVWKHWDQRRTGEMSLEDWQSMENGIARSAGTCMTMGTAATLMSIAEALGMCLPNASSIPAVDANHQRMAYNSGKRAVQLVQQDIKPTDILTKKAFENAIVVHMALGGSTNAIIHLIALAKRAKIQLDLNSFDQIAGNVPLLSSIRPSGKYLMEDFYYAGGLTALMNNLQSKLNLDCQTINGQTVRQNIENAKVYLPDVIHNLENPVQPAGSTVALFGTLAPNGAIIKPTAADPKLLQHTGPAVVFENMQQLKDQIDSPDLEVTKDSVLVLKNAGPIGGPGMPEWGMLPIPKKLLQQGVKDMVRISDARMSGTSYGACVLHVAPEAAIGGPLALVQNGDLIRLDVKAKKLDLLVDADVVQQRQKAFTPPKSKYLHGYAAMYMKHVTQADQGCDFDFMQDSPGEVPEPDIF